jgi:hypothetical protein
MGSFEGEDDLGGSNTGDGGEGNMDGVMHTNSIHHTEISAEDCRRFSLPNIEAQHVPSSEISSLKHVGNPDTGVADKRMTGRPIVHSNSSPRLSLYSQSSIDEPVLASDTSGTPEHHESKHHNHDNHNPRPHHDRLLAQVAEWLQAEKAKRAARRAKRRGKGIEETGEEDKPTTRPRTSSRSSDSSAIGQMGQEFLDTAIARRREDIANEIALSGDRTTIMGPVLHSLKIYSIVEDLGLSRCLTPTSPHSSLTSLIPLDQCILAIIWEFLDQPDTLSTLSLFDGQSNSALPNFVVLMRSAAVYQARLEDV